MDTKQNNTPKPKHRFIRLNEVLSITGYGRTSIYRKMEEGTFPKSLKLGGPPKDPSIFDSRAIAWIEDEIDQWVEDRIDERHSV
jgi:prophage regulatory protein